MTKTHTVLLHFAKSVREPVKLSYRQVPLDLLQARLAGREALIPNVDLNDYICNAVIDWILVEIQLGRVTQQQWLVDAFAGFHRRPHIVPLHPGLGKESTSFKIKVQEPDIAELRRIMASIDRKYGLTSEPIVMEMEISVDFRPKVPSDDARARMTGVLWRHLAPSLDIFNQKKLTPRFAWGTGRRIARMQESSSPRDPYRFAVVEVANPPSADATVYFGPEEGDGLIRVMDKVRDRQNRSAGTYEELSPAEQRCRVEVVLMSETLTALRIRTLEDVASFPFANLQGDYFQFKLPTVEALPLGPSKVYREKQRLKKFFTAGISGLAQMDRANLSHVDSKRALVRREMRGRGLTPRDAHRTGTGPYGTAVAYPELSKKVQTALSNLSRALRH